MTLTLGEFERIGTVTLQHYNAYAEMPATLHH
jgi:hypothetical protein